MLQKLVDQRRIDTIYSLCTGPLHIHQWPVVVTSHSFSMPASLIPAFPMPAIPPFFDRTKLAVVLWNHLEGQSDMLPAVKMREVIRV